MSNRFPKFYERLRTTPLRLNVWSMITVLQADAYLSGLPRRGALPDPFDVGSHQGNVNDSLPTGALGGYLASRMVERFVPNASPRAQRSAIVAGALAVGAIVNAAVEFKWGQRLVGDHVFGPHSTADPLDFIYGTTSAGISSAVIVPKPQEISVLPLEAVDNL